MVSGVFSAIPLLTGIFSPPWTRDAPARLERAANALFSGGDAGLATISSHPQVHNLISSLFSAVVSPDPECHSDTAHTVSLIAARTLASTFAADVLRAEAQAVVIPELSAVFALFARSSPALRAHLVDILNGAFFLLPSAVDVGYVARSTVTTPALATLAADIAGAHNSLPIPALRLLSTLIAADSSVSRAVRALPDASSLGAALSSLMASHSLITILPALQALTFLTIDDVLPSGQPACALLAPDASDKALQLIAAAVAEPRRDKAPAWLIEVATSIISVLLRHPATRRRTGSFAAAPAMLRGCLAQLPLPSSSLASMLAVAGKPIALGTMAGVSDLGNSSDEPHPLPHQATPSSASAPEADRAAALMRFAALAATQSNLRSEIATLLLKAPVFLGVVGQLFAGIHHKSAPSDTLRPVAAISAISAASLLSSVLTNNPKTCRAIWITFQGLDLVASQLADAAVLTVAAAASAAKKAAVSISVASSAAGPRPFSDETHTSDVDAALEATASPPSHTQCISFSQHSQSSPKAPGPAPAAVAAADAQPVKDQIPRFPAATTSAARFAAALAHAALLLFPGRLPHGHGASHAHAHARSGVAPLSPPSFPQLVTAISATEAVASLARQRLLDTTDKIASSVSAQPGNAQHQEPHRSSDPADVIARGRGRGASDAVVFAVTPPSPDDDMDGLSRPMAGFSVVAGGVTAGTGAISASAVAGSVSRVAALGGSRDLQNTFISAASAAITHTLLFVATHPECDRRAAEVVVRSLAAPEGAAIVALCLTQPADSAAACSALALTSHVARILQSAATSSSSGHGDAFSAPQAGASDDARSSPQADARWVCPTPPTAALVSALGDQQDVVRKLRQSSHSLRLQLARTVAAVAAERRRADAAQEQLSAAERHSRDAASSSRQQTVAISAEWERKLSRAVQERDRFAQDLRQKSSELDDANSARTDLLARLQSQGCSITSIRSELEDLRARLAASEDRADRAVTEAQGKSAGLEQFREQLTDAQDTLWKSQEEATQARRALEALQERSGDMEQELGDLRATRAQLEEKLVIATAAATSARRAAVTAQSELDALRTSSRAAQQRSIADRAARTAAEEREANANAEVASMRDQLDAIQNQFHVASTDRDQLAVLRGELEAALAGLRSDLHAYVQSARQSADRISELESTRTALAGQLADARSTLTALRSRLGQVETALEEKSDAHETLKAAVASAGRLLSPWMSPPAAACTAATMLGRRADTATDPVSPSSAPVQAHPVQGQSPSSPPGVDSSVRLPVGAGHETSPPRPRLAPLACPLPAGAEVTPTQHVTIDESMDPNPNLPPRPKSRYFNQPR
jgi:predicted  nucleic acid-binding Zn-ribbon protein